MERLKAYAVTSTTRSESLPDVPTMQEADLAQRLLADLSGVGKQRVLLARALAQRPQWYAGGRPA